MCENLHYESVYFKIYRTEAAVVSTITSCKHCSESAFDKSHDEEMSEMSGKSGKSGKGGWKITATSDKK